MRKTISFLLISLLAFLALLPLSSFAQVQERFPKPDFQSEYVRPDLLVPSPRSQLLEYLDILVLLVALSLATYFAHKLRSRRKIFVLMVLSLAYFGFFRKGCVCSVGAVQNIALALFDSTYAIPLSVLIFFLLPLVFSLFFGRTFCAAVCPLGAAQDVVILKPVKVAPWLANILGLFPYFYLGLAVLFAATGAGFVICQYDPFIGFFRFGAGFNMVILGVSLLLLGTVVARPYCRFLCPYGVLLNWMSRLSRRHVNITPSECTNCRLCEESCPFGAIKKASDPVVRETRPVQIRRVAVLVVLLPLIVLGTAWVGSNLFVPLSRQHFSVFLAERIFAENQGQVKEPSDETTAFRAAGKPTAELYAEAAAIQERYKMGGGLLGAFFGLIVGIKLIGFSIRRRQSEYAVDTGHCLSCARCFAYCPFEQARLGLIGPEELETLSHPESQKTNKSIPEKSKS